MFHKYDEIEMSSIFFWFYGRTNFTFFVIRYRFDLRNLMVYEIWCIVIVMVSLINIELHILVFKMHYKHRESAAVTVGTQISFDYGPGWSVSH